MKKTIHVLLVLVLVLCMSATAFAETIGGEGGSTTVDVKGTYKQGGAETIVYSVDIIWGSMEFTYTSAGAGTWDPSTHKSDGQTDAAWSCINDANKITVTNHSNTAVKATFAYASEPAYETVNGSFGNSPLNLATAIGTQLGSAPSGNATLTLSGSLAQNVSAKTKVGTVTITINKGN
ncbi:MAG: hypothetical protein GX352_00320 [Clostridiales bacterium]|nr:hypothetical protein [Clostridiales bacterium]